MTGSVEGLKSNWSLEVKKGKDRFADIVSYKWYGFDLDGTIANNEHHAGGFGLIGKPIKRMVSLMKRLHRKGYEVKIVTARINDVFDEKSREEVREHIWQWCDENLGFRPEITDTKDGLMEALYDDRAKQVVRNKGVTYEEVNHRLAECLEEAIKRLPKVTIKDKEFVGNCLDILKSCRA